MELKDKSQVYFQILNKQWKQIKAKKKLPLDQVKNRPEKTCDEAVLAIIKLTPVKDNAIEFDKQRILKIYMNEIWLTELPPPPGVDTGPLIDLVILHNESAFKQALVKMVPTMAPSEVDSWWSQMSNLYIAAETLFSSTYSKREISVELISEVHSMVEHKEVVQDAGHFRKSNVRASGSSVVYIEHELVSSRLNRLIEFTNTHLAEIAAEPNREIQFKLKIFLAGFFFSEFLLIHPFHDGNGRTARLLLSHILRKDAVVPVSLYFRGGRAKYLDVLEQRGTDAPPWGLLCYVVDCVLDTTRRATWHTALSYLQQLKDSAAEPDPDPDDQTEYQKPSFKDQITSPAFLTLLSALPVAVVIGYWMGGRR